MCRLLHNFNLRPAFQKPFEEPDSALGVQCKEILFESERLIEECRNVIRDRRMAKELEGKFFNLYNNDLKNFQELFCKARSFPGYNRRSVPKRSTS